VLVESENSKQDVRRSSRFDQERDIRIGYFRREKMVEIPLVRDHVPWLGCMTVRLQSRTVFFFADR
jgi:hypothetical protein